MDDVGSVLLHYYLRVPICHRSHPHFERVRCRPSLPAGKGTARAAGVKSSQCLHVQTDFQVAEAMQTSTVICLFLT
jgi:hypothetical protein